MKKITCKKFDREISLGIEDEWRIFISCGSQWQKRIKRYHAEMLCPKAARLVLAEQPCNDFSGS